MSSTVIKVQNLSKRYRLGQKGKRAETLVGNIRNLILSPFENLKRLQSLNRFKDEDESVFWALKNINFEVKEGEVLGIIGKNGAGKSTLLKILSGITDPTSGRIEIRGRVASLLEVGTGFHPELSGRENIFMNGTILGMSRQEINSKLEEIIEFSGVEKFIDTPVKFYSSGMKVRLGFSVAAHLEPEILIIDEVLAVGDFEFQKKCLGKMEDVSKNQGRTVLFVSHNLGAVSSLCTQALVLNLGKTIYYGETSSGISEYLSSNQEKIQFENEVFSVDDFKLRNSLNEIVSSISHDENFGFIFSFYSKIKIKSCVISFVLFTIDNIRISTVHVKPFDISKGLNVIEVFIQGGNLVPNSYFVYLDIHDDYQNFFIINRVFEFTVFDNGSEFYKWDGQDIGKLLLKYSFKC